MKREAGDLPIWLGLLLLALVFAAGGYAEHAMPAEPKHRVQP